MHCVYPPLSIKKNDLNETKNNTTSEIDFSEHKEKTIIKKQHVKITLNRRNKEKDNKTKRSTSTSLKKTMSTKDRKNAILTPKSNKNKTMFKKEEFIIYDADHLEAIVAEQHHNLHQF